MTAMIWCEKHVRMWPVIGGCLDCAASRQLPIQAAGETWAHLRRVAMVHEYVYIASNNRLATGEREIVHFEIDGAEITRRYTAQEVSTKSLMDVQERHLYPWRIGQYLIDCEATIHSFVDVTFAQKKPNGGYLVKGFAVSSRCTFPDWIQHVSQETAEKHHYDRIVAGADYLLRDDGCLDGLTARRVGYFHRQGGVDE